MFLYKEKRWVFIIFIMVLSGCSGSAPRPPYVLPIKLGDKEICKGESVRLSPLVSDTSLYEFYWSGVCNKISRVLFKDVNR